MEVAPKAIGRMICLLYSMAPMFNTRSVVLALAKTGLASKINKNSFAV